ncbi:MAG: RHS repeat-associated core domain-containing protein, partial [Terriglobia bacterium]
GPCANWTFNAANNRISGFGYDPAGDVTTDGGTGCTYTWDAERRLQSVSTCRTATFTTNALGQTVETLASNYRQEFILDLSGLGLASLNGSNGSWYDQDFFLGSQKIGNYIGTITQFDHFNQLTSTAMAFDGTGTWQQDQTFYPWGQQWKNVGTYDDLHFGTMTTDGELWYTNARRYSSNQGRWLSPDPLGADVTNPQSLNRYPYVLNNPTTLTDPSGLDACAQASDPHECHQITYWGLGNSITPNFGPWDEFDMMGDAGDPCSDPFYAESNAQCGGFPGLPGAGASNIPIPGGAQGGVWGQSGPPCNGDPTGCVAPPSPFPWWLITGGTIYALSMAQAAQTPAQQPQKPWCEDVFVTSAIGHALSPIPDLSNLAQLGGAHGFYYISKWWITRQALKVGASATGSVAAQRLGVAASKANWIGIGLWFDVSLGEALWDEVSAMRGGVCR